jgi:hypothetical protein
MNHICHADSCWALAKPWTHRVQREFSKAAKIKRRGQSRHHGAGWLLELSCHDPVAHNAAADISSTAVSIMKALRFSDT